MVLGLVLGSAVFVLGLVICSLVAIEWTMDAWADRATGDAEAKACAIAWHLEIPVAAPSASRSWRSPPAGSS